MSKDTETPKPENKRNNSLSYSDFKTLIAELNENEINRLFDLLLTLQQKP